MSAPLRAESLLEACFVLLRRSIGANLVCNGAHLLPVLRPGMGSCPGLMTSVRLAIICAIALAASAAACVYGLQRTRAAPACAAESARECQGLRGTHPGATMRAFG